jgi:hypothetical protein
MGKLRIKAIQEKPESRNCDLRIANLGDNRDFETLPAVILASDASPES